MQVGSFIRSELHTSGFCFVHDPRNIFSLCSSNSASTSSTRNIG
jgi:hypothetical protein